MVVRVARDSYRSFCYTVAAATIQPDGFKADVLSDGSDQALRPDVLKIVTVVTQEAEERVGQSKPQMRLSVLRGQNHRRNLES